MERTIQRVQGIERVNFFPVRHLSPAASYHLIKLLNKVKPKCILIEGPSDGTEFMKEIAGKNVKPPIAILAYTKELPIDTILYPFAEYSPEYQAILWGIQKEAEVKFIDLPTDVSLSLNRYKAIRDEEIDLNENEGIHNLDINEGIIEPDKKKDRNDLDINETDSNTLKKERQEYYKLTNQLYDSVAKLSEEVNYDAYWERNFEHNLNENAYQESLLLHSANMRELLESGEITFNPLSASREFVREAYMRSKIDEALSKYPPEKIVVITGAYHSKKLIEETIAMTEEEIKSLPRRASKLTLMPYSYYRLSSRSGYGAGNSAPAYYEMMWKLMKEDRLSDLPKLYITTLGRYVRESGGYCSTASIIEAVRLSMGLAALKGGSQPTLLDLHDGAIACIGHGDFSEVATAFAQADIGTAFGELPEGVSQTPIQDDFNRILKKLKLEKYKTTVAQELELDLRENRRVKSEELAFIDLNRSTFFHRLQFLGINFIKKQNVSQDSATWREKWVLAWSPEVEIQVVESVLKGETIELAAAFVLKEKLEECTDILDAAELITTSYICKLTNGVESALSTLQALTTESANFPKTAKAAKLLSMLIQYGSIRLVDTLPLVPLLQQIFLRACLILSDAATCDDKAASEIASAMGTMHTISQENYEIINDEIWKKALMDLAMRDDKNAILSGLAFAILLERNLVEEDMCSKEVNRRLSPGVPADLGAGWFEGLSMRNRYALLSRIELFRELNEYIKSLEEDEFKRSVVFMRRAFGAFEPREKNSVAELLGDIWGMNSADISIMLQAPLEEEEIEALEGLDDFDFDF